MFRHNLNLLHRSRLLFWDNPIPALRRHVKQSVAASTRCLSSDKSQTLPEETRVVICGGGVVGASVAFHLAEKGWSDVILLEQGSLTGGTTWHAAGLIGQTRRNPEEMRVITYSRHLYEQLDKEDYGTGWKQCGSLNLAQTNDILIDLRRIQDVARTHGIETHVVDGAEVRRMCPLLRTDDLAGALWIPQDGVVSPTDVTMALAKKAKEKGVKIFEKVSVDQVVTENGKVQHVKTPRGDIKCDIFVNCAGQWAREVGQKTVPKAVKAPLQSCEHYSIVTKPMPGIERMMPVIRDIHGRVTIREWNGGVMCGGFEPKPKVCFHDKIPDKFEFQLLHEDWDQFQVLLDNLLHRLPSLAEAEIRQLINGPESFTPDAACLLGESPMVKNYFIAAGMNSRGIAGAGGLGKCLAEWIVAGEASADLWCFDVRRFIRLHNNKMYLKDRIPEAAAMFGPIKFPYEEFKSGRNLRCSPLHTRLEAANAVFGEAMAYERALYFDDPEVMELDDSRLRTWSKPSWFKAVQEEYWACKERVSLLDVSSFAKFEVRSAGNEATEFLQYLCSNNIDNEVGTIVHTGMQNKNGGFENDCTVTRLERNHYFITCLASQQTRAISWLKSHLPEDGSVQVTDVTSMFSGIALIGPHAQQLLADVGDISTSKPDFKPMTANIMDVSHASIVRAMRLTHTGEDGFILYVPSEYALHVYDMLMAAGKDYGIRNVGFYALRHLRIENFFAYWGLDLDDKTTPLECGRGFRTKMDSQEDFLGKSALLKQREEGVGRRFTQFLLDDFDVHQDNWPWGGEPIYRNGQFAGVTTTCGYGFSLEKMACLGFVGDLDKQGNVVRQQNINEWVMDKDANYEIVIAGVRVPARPGIYTPKINTHDTESFFVPAPQALE